MKENLTMTTEAIEKTEKQEITRTEDTRSAQRYRPNVDIIEAADELTLLADIPGATGDSIDIAFEDGILTIHGRVDRPDPEGAKPVLREYGVGDFYRTFQVGEKIDASKISAEYKDGVLRLRLPKIEEIKARKIAVEA
jgi:HSP20 family protein